MFWFFLGGAHDDMQFYETEKHTINIELESKKKKVTASTKNICKPSTHIWWGMVMEQRKARLSAQ